MLHLIAGVSLGIIAVILIVEVTNNYIHSSANIRWKEVKRKKDSVYIIQKRFFFFLWGEAIKIGDTGYPEEIIFSKKEDAIRFVDVHRIRKQFNKKKRHDHLFGF